jgi:hypothetical protein
MQANDTTAEKRTAVEHLNFGAKTTKRVTWEAWEFTVVGPHQVEVTNASYGFLKDDHSYTVGVEEHDEVTVPVECGCPADRHREDYACKHRVALATVGGPTVMDAALDAEALADGGAATETCPNGDPTCPGPDADADTMPYFACYGTSEDA